MATAWTRPKASDSATGLPIQVNTDELASIGRRLRASGHEGAVAFRGAMRAGGELVAADARDRSSFSKRIPGSIVVRTTGSNFKVRAGGASAPDAAPIENKGKGFVRHPTYSPRPAVKERVGWTDKKSHAAFLAPALAAKADEVVAVVMERLDEAIARALGG